MSVRRRNIRERVERERRFKAGSDALTLSLQQIQNAITAALARGETTCTDRFLQEAFGAAQETRAHPFFQQEPRGTGPLLSADLLKPETSADECMAKVRQHFDERRPAENICPTTGQPHQPGNACIYCHIGNLARKPCPVCDSTSDHAWNCSLNQG